MGGRNLLILGIAVLIGLIAVFLANSYFSGYEEREEQLAEERQMARIVVATQNLEFGTPLASTNLRLVNWPASSVPAGAFRSIPDATRGGRVALRPITVGEPILNSKVSGEGGRASLASILPEEARAVAIPISAVSAVGGFVRPGDVVDVMLTRQIEGDGASSADKFTSVVLENVLVLAIDQVANDNATEPAVGNTATIQTDIYGAQKLALATQIGSLSLALRNVENQNVGASEVISTSDLPGSGRYIAARDSGGGSTAPVPTYVPAPAPAPRAANTNSSSNSRDTTPRVTGPSMTIVRGTEGTQYPVERQGGR